MTNVVRRDITHEIAISDNISRKAVCDSRLRLAGKMTKSNMICDILMTRKLKLGGKLNMTLWIVFRTHSH